jgi:hypothetical protein
VHTSALLVRRLRSQSSLGSWGEWTYEVGESVTKFKVSPRARRRSPAAPSCALGHSLRECMITHGLDQHLAHR